MLIKIVFGSACDIGYLNEQYIDFVREMPDGKSWRVHSLGEIWFLNKDENEPFKYWLSWQIGGANHPCKSGIDSSHYFYNPSENVLCFSDYPSIYDPTGKMAAT